MEGNGDYQAGATVSGSAIGDVSSLRGIAPRTQRVGVAHPCNAIISCYAQSGLSRDPIDTPAPFFIAVPPVIYSNIRLLIQYRFQERLSSGDGSSDATILPTASLFTRRCRTQSSGLCFYGVSTGSRDACKYKNGNATSCR